MKLLEERIRRDGKIRENGTILKVDSFLNHQIDLELYGELGKEFYRLFGAQQVDKILTVEASGIGIACVTGQQFHVPVLFAKKSRSKNIDADVYRAPVKSFTYGSVYDVTVSKDFLRPGERILIIDDFLANGAALDGLISIVGQAGAELVGAGICVEKAFQPGGARLREKGIRIESLARIKSMGEDGIEFCE